MKRIKLKDRLLPDYTRGEEWMNMVTHIVGGGVGVAALGLCLSRALRYGDGFSLAGALIYGLAMILLYTMSSVYHGLAPSTGKKVLQVLDHCTIYLLIAGTYTPIALCNLRTVNPALGWGMLIFQWGLAAVAVTLTAIDLKKYNVFSMICYIGMGWCVIVTIVPVYKALTFWGFMWLLGGGIMYTIGAVLFCLGTKKRYIHSIFHIFVVLASLMHFICIFFFAI